MEAQSIIVRYLEEKEEVCRPVERLIDVFTTGDTSGESLCESLVSSLNKVNVNLDVIIGQSYDGASNMRGRYSGLRSRSCSMPKKHSSCGVMLIGLTS